MTFFNYYPECSDTTTTYESGSNKKSGNSVLKLKASDADGNKLQFSLTNESNSSGIFSINETNGEIQCENIDTLSQTYILQVNISDGMASTISEVSLTFNNTANYINTNQELNNIKIYPNPTKDFINIDINGNKGKETNVQLINIEGKQIFNKIFINSNEKEVIQINLPDLIRGTYLLIIKQEQNINNFKLIIN